MHTWNQILKKHIRYSLIWIVGIVIFTGMVIVLS